MLVRGWAARTRSSLPGHVTSLLKTGHIRAQSAGSSPASIRRRIWVASRESRSSIRTPCCVPSMASKVDRKHFWVNSRTATRRSAHIGIFEAETTEAQRRSRTGARVRGANGSQTAAQTLCVFRSLDINPDTQVVQTPDRYLILRHRASTPASTWACRSASWTLRRSRHRVYWR